MARNTYALALLALSCFLCSTRVAHAVPADELTFAKIGSVNATKQWSLSVFVKKEDQADFSPLNCTKAVLGGCTDRYPPLQQDSNDKVRVDYKLSNLRGPGGVLATYNQATPTKVQFRICFAPASSVNRAWRTKNKPYPRLSQNCPHKFGEFQYVAGDAAANSGTAVLDFSTLDEIPTATWFVMAWVYCGDSVCAFESTEGNAAAVPPVPGNFFETEVEMGITPGMRAAAIILSIFGPAFFIIFWIADSIKYKKTGKPIVLY